MQAAVQLMLRRQILVSSRRLVAASKPPQRTKAMAQPLWIDTDAGIDDAQALVLAMGSDNSRIVGISTVHGNTAISNVNQNVLRVLTACGKDDVPVYVGCSEPMVCDPFVSSAPYHGHDGLGDAPGVWPSMADVKARINPGSAVVKLIECATKHEGQLQVLALGPLTNLALAVKLDPELPSRIRRLVIMGGANGPGNMSPHAEFNFYCDPEAAKVVMAKFSNVVLVPRDLGLTHLLDWDKLEHIMSKPSRVAAFLAGISALTMTPNRRNGIKEAGYLTHDPGAALVAVMPEAITSSARVYCDVEVQGQHTRGMSVMDWEGHAKKQPNVDVITGVNMAMFWDLYERATD